jgi:hypothetical protein
VAENRELTEAQMNDELTRVFNDGSVFNASDDDLNKYLKHLCSGHVPNEMVRHREMNRCQVINTVKTFRFINSVERSNKIFTVIIIILTVVTVILSYVSISQSKDSSAQIERLITSQENTNQTIVDKLTSQIERQNIQIEELTKQNESIAKELNILNASNKASKKDGAKKRAAP